MKASSHYKKNLLDIKIQQFCESCEELLTSIHDRHKSGASTKPKQKGKRRHIA